MRFLSALLIICLCLSGCGGGDYDEAKQMTVIRLATDLSEKDAAYRQLERFSQKVNESSEGQIQIKLYADSEWDSSSSLLDYLNAGALEMVCLSTDSLTEVIPQYALYSYPSLFADAQSVYAYAKSEAGQAALSINPEYQILGFAANGYLYFQHLFVADNLYSYDGGVFYGTVSDTVAEAISWLKIRFTNEENNTPGLNHVLAEGYLNYLIDLNVINESSYLTDPDVFYLLEAVMVNQSFWQRLSAQEQEIITSAFYSALEEECTYQNNLELEEILPQGGISFYPWSIENKTQIYQYLRSLSENYILESQNPLGSYFIPQTAVTAE